MVRLSADNTTIGGTVAGASNMVSGNTGCGILVDGADTTGTVIEGNLIGVDLTGTGPLPNTTDGIRVANFATDVRIGDDLASAANVIAHNGSQGVAIKAGTDDVVVLSNSIHSNGVLGIDIDPVGINPNDVGDPDVGPNDLLNFPVTISAEEAGGTVVVYFDLDVPAGTYRVEMFTNPGGADPSGSGEGEVLVDANVVVHTGSGAESFKTAFSGALGDVVTATATNQTVGPIYYATSEFSAAAVTVPAVGPVGQWRFNEGSGTTALDSSGFGNHGTITGAAYVPGVSGTALDFTGNSLESVEITDDPTGILEIGTGDFSLSAWFQTTNLPPPGENHRLVDKLQAGEGFELFIRDNGGTELVFKAWDDLTEYRVATTAPLDTA